MPEIGYAVSNGQFLLPTSYVLSPLFHGSGWLGSKSLVQRWARESAAKDGTPESHARPEWSEIF